MQYIIVFFYEFLCFRLFVSVSRLYSRSQTAGNAFWRISVAAVCSRDRSLRRASVFLRASAAGGYGSRFQPPPQAQKMNIRDDFGRRAGRKDAIRKIVTRETTSLLRCII